MSRLIFYLQTKTPENDYAHYMKYNKKSIKEMKRILQRQLNYFKLSSTLYSRLYYKKNIKLNNAVITTILLYHLIHIKRLILKVINNNQATNSKACKYCWTSY